MRTYLHMYRHFYGNAALTYRESSWCIVCKQCY